MWGLVMGKCRDVCKGHNLSPDLGAGAPISLYEHYPAIAEIAHVPVNLQILCCLVARQWRLVCVQEASNGSLPGLYRRLTEYIVGPLRRATEECACSRYNMTDCEELFDTLGQDCFGRAQARAKC